jgi:hypothetical protein
MCSRDTIWSWLPQGLHCPHLEGDDALAWPRDLLHHPALDGKLLQDVGLRQHAAQRPPRRQPVDQRALDVGRILPLRLADDLPEHSMTQQMSAVLEHAKDYVQVLTRLSTS